MKTVAIAMARMGSTRVPGKVMRDLGGKPVLRWTIDAIKASMVDEVVLATSTLPADDVIEAYCKEHKIECFRGSEADVLDRYYQCAKQYHADIVLRFTCDCPFLDPNVINEVVKLREMTDASYASNCYPLVILMALILSASPSLRWRQRGRKLRARLIESVSLSSLFGTVTVSRWST